MLALLVMLVVLMPVSYRAGTDASHPHTIFQELIDLVVGQPHHHHDDGHAHGTADDHRAAERAEPALAAPDMPTWLGLSNPVDATAAIHALGALVAALLLGTGQGVVRAGVPNLTGRNPGVDPPPPRFA
jgi:hypothetical protein